MGDEGPTPKQNARDLFKYLAQYAPDAIRAISGTTPELAETELGIDESQRGRINELYRQQEQGALDTEAALAGSSAAGSLVGAADKYQRQLDPEYYASRALMGDALKTYLTSYDPTKLSPTEEAQITRGIGATSGSLTPSNMNTVRNAMTFGDRGTERWKNFGDAILKASSAMPQLRSGLIGFNIGTSRGNATGKDYSGNAAGTGFGFASSALGDMAGVNQASIQKRKDTFDKMSESTGFLKGIV